MVIKDVIFWVSVRDPCLGSSIRVLRVLRITKIKDPTILGTSALITQNPQTLTVAEKTYLFRDPYYGIYIYIYR